MTAAATTTTLVTGASSGIGEALAARFARAGHPLVLVARSAGKLEALAKRLRAGHRIEVTVIGADLAAPDAAERLAAALEDRRITVDVLVNNAGVLEKGRFVDIPAAAQQAMVALNVQGLTALLAAFVPGMVARGHGRVLNVASIAAFQPVPMLATYAATKAYVLSLTESLSEELQGTGVTITTLCPGITATSMLDKAKAESTELEGLPGFVVGTAEDVADQGFTACMQGEVIRVPGALNLAATMAGRATPRWLLRRVSGAMVRRLKSGD